MHNFRAKANFIWGIADLLRGDYKPSEYADVILPLLVLRRLDCVLEPTKADVLASHEAYRGRIDRPEALLMRTAGFNFYNTSPFDFAKLRADPPNLAGNLRAYVQGFSPNVRDILAQFDFGNEIERLARVNLLFLVVDRFGGVDLHPPSSSITRWGTSSRS